MAHARRQILRSFLLLAAGLTAASLLSAGDINFVAVHVSEKTRSWSTTSASLWPEGWRPWHIHKFLEEALRRDGIPFVEIDDNQVATGGLLNQFGQPRYPIVFSWGNDLISDTTATAFATYVSLGGRVFVGSSSWTRDENGGERRTGLLWNRALQTEMGVSGGGWTMVNTAGRVATSPMIDQVDAVPPAPARWMLPRSWNPSETWSLYDSPHWIWATAPTTMTRLLAPGQETGFFKSINRQLETGQFSYMTDSILVGSLDPAATAVAFGDVNGDSRADLVWQTPSGDIRVGLSNGQGFMPSVSSTPWLTGWFYSVVIADIDADGKGDLVGRSGSSVKIAFSSGSSFTAQASPPAGHFWSSTYSLDFVRLNNDNYVDLVGRSGTDVQVGLWNNTTKAWQPSSSWTTWATSYDVRFGDVNKDGRADIIGRNQANDIQVGINSGSGFGSSTSWGTWVPNQTDLIAGDVNGDGWADLLGRDSSNGQVRVALSNGTSPFNVAQPYSNSLWRPELGLSCADFNGDGRCDLVGRRVGTDQVRAAVSAWGSDPNSLSPSVLIGEKTYGTGRFIYTADFQPLAGYGGDAEANTNYKAVQIAIRDALIAQGQPMTRVSAWPYPYQSAFIFRHDHVLHSGIVDLEACRGVRGEYYIIPNVLNQNSDFPTQAATSREKGAYFGIHTRDHQPTDQEVSQNAARDRIVQTANDVWLQAASAGMTPSLRIDGFVAPNYQAIRKESMLAILDADNQLNTTAIDLTYTGEQGFSPFPGFALDPTTEGARVTGTVSGFQRRLFELPVGGVLWQRPWAPNQKSVDLAYLLRGLINVYDHAEHTPDAWGNNGVQNATQLLNYVFDNKPDVWKTTSRELRDWALRKETRALTSVQVTPLASTTDIVAQLGTASPAEATNWTDWPIAIRLKLTPALLTRAQQGIAVQLDGSPSADYRLHSTSSELLVRVGGSSTVKITLGPKSSTITTVSPSSGPVAGGVVMNINGTGFSPTALTVSIGGVQSSSVTYNGPNLLTAAIPASGSVGAANVVVLNGGSPTASLPWGYFYNFGDVPTSHPRQPGVAALHRNGVTAGCTPPNFCPGDNLLRNQAAVFLLRAKEGRAYLPPPGIGWFTDMAADPTRDWAEDLFNRGVTAGCWTRLYCPGASMTRAQFAVFLLKVKEGRCYVPPAPGGVFSDTSGNPLAAWADEIGRRGAPGCGGTNFCPDQFVNIGDAAEMIRVIFNLS